MGNPTASADDVTRLLGRVAFGATEADLDAWTGKPYAALVEHLLDVPAIATRAPAVDEARRLSLAVDADGRFVRIDDGTDGLDGARGWWLERMRTTPYPLEERMTLLWHGHFATGPGTPYPNQSMLMAQNQTIRSHALGSFSSLVTAMTIDPAMLYWLNGAENAPPEPNENYAREFFELFTLGKSPQVYSETDIREAARAFTGWTVDFLGRPSFKLARHDRGRKLVLRRDISDLGEKEHLAVAEVALAHPVAARFIAWKLVAGLAYEPVPANLLARPDPLVRAVADTLRASSWDIRAALRRLLLDDRFRAASPARGQQLVRQPVDVVVSAAKALGVSADGSEQLHLLAEMGQRLFAPPNVGGWPVEREWFSPSTMIARYDFGLALHRQHILGSAELALDPLPPPDDVPAFARRLGLARVSPTTVAAVRRYLDRRKDAGVDERESYVLALLLASPDWMVM